MAADALSNASPIAWTGTLSGMGVLSATIRVVSAGPASAISRASTGAVMAMAS